MTHWKSSQAGARNAIICDLGLRAYPARHGGTYAIHLRAIFGIASNTPFSIMRCTRYMDGTVSLPRETEVLGFTYMRLSDAPEFSLDGEVVAAGVHAICYTNAPRLEECLAQVSLHLGIKICHPYEDETVVDVRAPLYVQRGTGPLAARTR